MMIPLHQLHIRRPEKIIYDFRLSEPADVINIIKSDSLRLFLRNTDEILAKNNIVWKCDNLTEQMFIDWLPYYKEKMDKQDYDANANIEWYQGQAQKGNIMKSIFLYQNKKRVGSIIFELHDNVANFQYKTSDRMPISSKKSGSLGSIIEFLFLKVAAESDNCTVATNRSRNAFGFYNNYSQLDYKLRFGYVPRPSPYLPLLDFVPVNEMGEVLFYGLQDKELFLFHLRPEGQNGDELHYKKRFVSSGIPFKEIYY